MQNAVWRIAFQMWSLRRTIVETLLGQSTHAALIPAKAGLNDQLPLGTCGVRRTIPFSDPASKALESRDEGENESPEETTRFPIFRRVGSPNTGKPCFGRRRTEEPTCRNFARDGAGRVRYLRTPTRV